MKFYHAVFVMRVGPRARRSGGDPKPLWTAYVKSVCGERHGKRRSKTLKWHTEFGHLNRGDIDPKSSRRVQAPTVGDQVAQKTVKLIVEARLEQIFHPSSFG